MMLHSALIGYVRQGLLDTPGVDIRHLARELRRDGPKAVDLLHGGLDGYAVRPAPIRHGGRPARRPPVPASITIPGGMPNVLELPRDLDT